MVTTLRPRVPRPTTKDLVAGISIALVLLPQSIAYAVLAGMPPQTGLAVAAVATIAAAPFVSSRYLQTGPAAISALLTFGALAPFAEPETGDYVALAALLALLVGVARIAIGATRTGVVAYLMSQPVLSGFTPAAAIVIIISQLPTAVGVSAKGGPAATLATLADLPAWDLHALGLALLTALVMLLGRRVHALFPAVLAAVTIGLVTAIVTGFDGDVVGALPGGLPTLRLALPWSRAPDLLLSAAVIALVGFAEASAIARTFAQETRTHWDADREFVSQGVANVAAGLVGAFPVGGSFSRSAVAKNAGARTAWSGAFTGLLVLAATPFLGVVEQLPRAVVAAIIIVAVSKLARLGDLFAYRRLSRQQFAISIITFVLTLALSPRIQIAVVVGVALSITAHLRRELAVAAPSWVEEDRLHVRPLGVLFFGSAHRLGEQLDDLIADHKEVTHVVIHMDRLGRVDVTGAMDLRQALDDLHAQDIATSIVDLTPTGRAIISRVLADPAYGVVLDAPSNSSRMPGQLAERHPGN